MDCDAAQQRAQQLMAQHGLIERGWSFSFNRRKQSLGLCNYTAKRIELSSLFVVRNDADEVVDTVRHEIAHALAGRKAGHGPAWAAVCCRIGAIPKRTCNTAAMPRGNFQARCPGCGKEHDRYRRPMRRRVYHCRACGPGQGRLRFVRAEVFESSQLTRAKRRRCRR